MVGSGACTYVCIVPCPNDPRSYPHPEPNLSLTLNPTLPLPPALVFTLTHLSFLRHVSPVVLCFLARCHTRLLHLGVELQTKRVGRVLRSANVGSVIADATAQHEGWREIGWSDCRVVRW